MNKPKHLKHQLMQPHLHPHQVLMLGETPEEKAKRLEKFRAMVQVEQSLTQRMRQFKEQLNQRKPSLMEIALTDRTVQALGIPQKLMAKQVQLSETGWLEMILYPRQFLLNLNQGAI
jgi:hypothetical protein